MNRFWHETISRLTPYTPGEQPKNSPQLKLNTNENPFGPSPKVIEAIQQNLNDNLRLYPDPESEKLKTAIANYYNLPEPSVFVGNGSDEVLAFIFRAFFQDKKLLFPDITYSFYPVYCNLYGIDYALMPLEDNFEIKLEKYQPNEGAVIFPNPNAPTGIPLELKIIKNFLGKNKNTIVVIDEAYVDFGTQSAIGLIEEFDNLIVTQSFSKSRSLAGLRVGCAFSQPELIEAICRVKNSFNSYPLDRLAQSAAIAAIEDEGYFKKTTQAVIGARSFLERELKNLHFNVLPSGANFIFTSHISYHAKHIFDQLKSHGILVRYFNQPAKIDNFLRITIGSMNQMQQLIKVLKQIVL